MKPRIHASSTGVLNVPVGWKVGDPMPEGALPVSRVVPDVPPLVPGMEDQFPVPLPQWTTFWKPTPRERHAISQGALIEVCIVALAGHPPIHVGVEGAVE